MKRKLKAESTFGANKLFVFEVEIGKTIEYKKLNKVIDFKEYIKGVKNGK